MRRWVRRWGGMGAVLALAGMGAASGAAPQLAYPGNVGLEPVALSETLFGPYSTAANNGYEGPNDITPVVPSSYVSRVSPLVIGVQFIGDSPADLRRDGFALSIAGPKGRPRSLRLTYFPTGLVGYRPVRALAPGRYEVTFTTPGFVSSQSRWQIDVTSSGPADLPTATAGDQRALSALNAYRGVLGEDPVWFSRRLAEAAIKHADYLAQNGYQAPSFHEESARYPGFTGSTPWARDMTFGWPSPLDGEVGIERPSPIPDLAVVQDLVDTVYHRLSLLSPNLLAEGEGAANGRTGAVVMDLGFGYRPNLPLAIVYPRPGQTGVPVSWLDLESPDPVPGGANKVFGYPITVDFPTVSRLTDVRVALYRDNIRVPAVVDWPGRGAMAPNQLALVPEASLWPDTIYSVEVLAEAAFNDGQTLPVALRWLFATGGGNRSVAAAPGPGGRLAVSVVQAGSGQPAGQVVVRLLYRSERRGWVRAAEGVTDAQGLYTFSRVRRPPGVRRYEVLTDSGNATVFWW